MAFTDPSGHIFVVSEVISAATMNTYIEADIAFLGTPPSVQVWNNFAETITNNTNTVLGMNIEQKKTDAGMHSNSVNNTRLVSTVTGTYLIYGNAEWATNGVGFRQLLIVTNGATTLASVNQTFTTSTPSQQNVLVVWAIPVTQYVELFCAQTSGGSLTVNTTLSSPRFAMHFLGF